MSSPKTILFLGATGGCGFSALRRSLLAGHTCIALCRMPSKLTDQLTASNTPTATLRLEQGNAHSVDDLLRCLLPSPTFSTSPSPNCLPDTIIFTIGLIINARLTLSDPHVCEKGMVALLQALTKAREEHGAIAGRPRLVALSTTGITELGRDLPLVMWAAYGLLKVPHEDKKKMEEAVVGSGEAWTIVRPSLLTDGKEDRNKRIRVGVEDPVARKVERLERGYAISREDVGRWVFEEVIEGGDRGRFVGRCVSLTW